MDDAEFEKYVELVASMSIDFLTKQLLSKETYIKNLEMIVKILTEQALKGGKDGI